MNTGAAYRAAGQAVAAALHGLPIKRVSLKGASIDWPSDAGEPDRPRCELLADVVIRLTGIAAQQGYGFGRAAPESCVVSWRFTAGQLDDFMSVRELIEEMDRSTDEDAFFDTWRQALAIVADPKVWRVIKAVAEELGDGELTATSVSMTLRSV